MDEYKQYYYSARPSAQGKAFGRWVSGDIIGPTPCRAANLDSLAFQPQNALKTLKKPPKSRSCYITN